MTDAEKIEMFKEKIAYEIDKYYWSVYLMIGIKDYLEINSRIGFRMVSCGKTMKPSDEDLDEPKPDVVLQNTDNSHGLLLEIKSAYPNPPYLFEKAMEKDITQLQSFDSDISGWECDGGHIEEYHIILMPYHEGNSLKIPNILDKKIQDDGLSFSHPFGIWFWSVDRSLKSSSDVIKIFSSEKFNGVGYEIGHVVDNDTLVINLNKLFIKYDQEKFRFGRDPPSNSVYTILQIYNVMGGVLRKPPSMAIICSVDDIMKLAETYLPAWIPDDGKKTQLRVKWVKNALDTLVAVKMAKKISADVYEWIEPNVKDYRGYLIEKVAELEASKDKYAMTTPRKDVKSVRQLNLFDENKNY